jgi:hypothetical protein
VANLEAGFEMRAGLKDIPGATCFKRFSGWGNIQPNKVEVAQGGSTDVSSKVPVPLNRCVTVRPYHGGSRAETRNYYIIAYMKHILFSWTEMNETRHLCGNALSRTH